MTEIFEDEDAVVAKYIPMVYNVYHYISTFDL